MSDRLGSVLFPGDYHPVRPGGQHGDTKNDGYCPKARVFFAAHATRGESAEKSKARLKATSKAAYSSIETLKSGVI
jgi:hypothetical protein